MQRLALVPGTIAVGTGQLPKVLAELRKAHIQLLRDSRAPTWGKAMLPLP